MNWKVTLDYARGPSFSTEAQADNAAKAIALAKAFARGCGYDAKVKKATAVEVPA
jgi:hypothetical protein